MSFRENRLQIAQGIRDEGSGDSSGTLRASSVGYRAPLTFTYLRTYQVLRKRGVPGEVLSHVSRIAVTDDVQLGFSPDTRSSWRNSSRKVEFVDELRTKRARANGFRGRNFDESTSYVNFRRLSVSRSFNFHRAPFHLFFASASRYS